MADKKKWTTLSQQRVTFYHKKRQTSEVKPSSTSWRF
jgi:hypothetical protein